MRFVVSKMGKNLTVLLKQVNTNSECIIEPTLTVLDEHGDFTDEASIFISALR